MRGDQLVAPPVVDRPLLPPVHTADRQPIRFVEMRDGLVMLQLAVLDHEPVPGPIAVDR